MSAADFDRLDRQGRCTCTPDACVGEGYEPDDQRTCVVCLHLDGEWPCPAEADDRPLATVLDFRRNAAVVVDRWDQAAERGRQRALVDLAAAVAADDDERSVKVSLVRGSGRIWVRLCRRCHWGIQSGRCHCWDGET